MCKERLPSQYPCMRTRNTLCLTLLFGAASCVCEAQSAATLSLLEKTMALQPDPHNGELLYIQYCSGCHRRSGWGNGPREVPTLAGQQEAYLLEQLIKFSTLDRNKPEMHEVVTKPELVHPQSLRDVSAYIASQPRDPSPDRGDGTQAGTGAKLYVQSCAICHGGNGEGNRDDVIPAIGGQQYGYLLVRLRAFAKDHASQERGSLEPAVVNLLGRLSPDEIKAVADYTSRLPALQANH
jgi:cytochrome c553